MQRFNFVGHDYASNPAASSAGGGGGGGGGSGQQQQNSITVTFNTSNRDHNLFPTAQNCTLPLPDTFNNISQVSLSSAEMPVTEFNVDSPVLYISELHGSTWVPFSASLSSGNYVVNDLVAALGYALSAARTIAGEFTSVRNTYTAVASASWGRIALSSNGACPFTLHFRQKPVQVTSAMISTSGQFLTVGYTDLENAPLSEGAAVTLILGMNIPPTVCVVNAVNVAARTVDLRIAPVVTTFSTQPTLPQSGTGQSSAGNLLTPVSQSLLTLLGTNTPGAVIPISLQSATMIPASAVGNNLGLLFGFGVSTDVGYLTDSSCVVNSIQPPLTQYDGTVVISTQFPHFCQPGDIFQLNNTGTFMDGYQQVKSILDETHVVCIINVVPFLSTFPPLILYLNGPGIEPVTMDIILSARLNSATQGTAQLTLTIKDVSAYYNIQTVANTQCFFAVDNAFYGGPFRTEFAYSNARIGAITSSPGSTYPDQMELTFQYPTQLVGSVGVMTLTRVGNPLTLAYDPHPAAPYLYIPISIISGGQIDFTRNTRYVYMALQLDGKTIGNVMTTALPNTRLFSKMALPSGRNAVSFLPKLALDSTYSFTTPASVARSLSVQIYDSRGALYDFQGVDFSFTLEIQCTSPIM
jgi:hypothetical protein